MSAYEKFKQMFSEEEQKEVLAEWKGYKQLNVLNQGMTLYDFGVLCSLSEVTKVNILERGTSTVMYHLISMHDACHSRAESYWQLDGAFFYQHTLNLVIKKKPQAWSKYMQLMRDKFSHDELTELAKELLGVVGNNWNDTNISVYDFCNRFSMPKYDIVAIYDESLEKTVFAGTMGEAKVSEFAKYDVSSYLVTEVGVIEITINPSEGE